MIRLPIKYRTENDDYAPIDYEFVGSIAEGQRRREAELLGQGADKAVVRRRAEPVPRSDVYGTRARQSAVVQPEKPQILDSRKSVMPGNPAVRSIAYPEGYENPLQGGSREAAESLSAPRGYEAQPEGTQQERAFPSLPSSPEPMASGGQMQGESLPPSDEFDSPVAPEIPEWLRMASHNNLPLADRPPRPRVTPANAPESPKPMDMLGRPIRRSNVAERAIPTVPQTAPDYEAAGYPQELLLAQEKRDRELEAETYGSKRHGARLAVPNKEREGRRAQSVRQSNEGMEDRRRQQGYAASPPGNTDRAPRAPAYPPPYPAQGYDSFSAPHSPQGNGMQETGRPYGEEIPGHGNDFSGTYPPQYASPYPVEHSGAYAPQYSAPHAPRVAPEYSPQSYGDMPLPPASHRQQRRNADPYVQEPWEENEPSAEKSGIQIPWLGISTAALALVAVLLWIFQMSFQTRADAAISAREKAALAVVNAYPYSYRELIETQAQLHNLHPAFIAAIVLNESSFRPNAESSVGARGLMQIMPNTAKWIHGKIGGDEAFDFDQMYDAATNVRYACWYMNYLSGLFQGDPVLMAAGFHAGQGEVKNWLSDSSYVGDSQAIVLEASNDGPTNDYVTKVLKAYAAYKRLYYENAGA